MAAVCVLSTHKQRTSFTLWIGHSERTVREVTPNGIIDTTLLTIPKGLTGQLQQINVSFRMWKQFVGRFSDAVMMQGSEINLHARAVLLN